MHGNADVSAGAKQQKNSKLAKVSSLSFKTD